jgi:outer membrane protein assembly factor BamD
MAEIRYKQKDAAKAFELYGQIVSDYPSYPAFDGILKKMFSLAEQMRDEKTSSFFGWRYKDRQAAIDAFEKIVIAAPYSDYAPRALSIIGRLYTEKHEGLSAIDAYQRLIAGYPNHPLVADAYWNRRKRTAEWLPSPYDQGATVKAIQTTANSPLFPTDDRVGRPKAIWSK